jgi:DNA-binding beta-propeller fold protein YncE
MPFTNRLLLLGAPLVGTFACAGIPSELPPLPAAVSGQFLAVATRDFQTGALHTIEIATMKVRRDIDVLDAQPVVRAFGSQVYVLDQTHGTARIYDASRDFAAPSELSFGKLPELPAAQANPYDIYVDAAKGRAYVTLYGSFGSTAVTGKTALGVLDLAQPGSLSSFIELPVAKGDSDNNPDASRLIACGGSLYVLLQDLDRTTYTPVGPGRLAVVSLADHSVRIIPLAGENPTALSILPGCAEAIVGSAGDQLSGSLSGRAGVERVDLKGEKSLGLVLRDSDLGGNVSTLEAASGRDVFVDVSQRKGTSYDNNVYLIDAVSGLRGQKLLGPMKYVPSLRVVGQQVVVLSAGSAGSGQLPPGLYVGPANGDGLPTTPIDLGLAPISTDLFSR